MGRSESDKNYSCSWSMENMLWENVIELVMSDVGDKSSLWMNIMKQKKNTKITSTINYGLVNARA